MRGSRQHSTCRTLPYEGLEREFSSLSSEEVPKLLYKNKESFSSKNKCSVKFLSQMVLQTEKSNFTYFVLLGMLLIAPISDPTVKIIRFSKDPTIAQIMLHLFKANYFQTEQRCDTSQNRHILNACCCLFCFFSQRAQQSDHFHGIIFCPVLCL